MNEIFSVDELMKAQKYSNNHKKGHFFKEKFSLFNLLANEKHKINIYFFLLYV